MALCAQVGDHLSSGPGAVITSSPQAALFVAGVPIVVVGAPVADHGSGAHNAAHTNVGSIALKVNGLGVVFTGAPATCGHTAIGTAPIDVTA